MGYLLIYIERRKQLPGQNHCFFFYTDGQHLGATSLTHWPAQLCWRWEAIKPVPGTACFPRTKEKQGLNYTSESQFQAWSIPGAVQHHDTPYSGLMVTLQINHEILTNGKKGIKSQIYVIKLASTKYYNIHWINVNTMAKHPYSNIERGYTGLWDSRGVTEQKSVCVCV